MNNATQKIKVIIGTVFDLGGEFEYYHAEVTLNGHPIGGVFGDKLADHYRSSLPNETITNHVMDVLRKRYEFQIRKIS